MSGELIPQGERHKVLRARSAHLAKNGAAPLEIFGALRVLRDERCAPGDLPSDEDLRALAESAHQKLGQVAESAESNRPFELLDLQAVWDNDIGEIPWILDGWMIEQDIVLVSGPGGIGKSTTIGHMAVCLATGNAWCGITPTRPWKVLHIDEEQGDRGMQRLMKRLLPVEPPETLLVASSQGVKLDTTVGVDAFEGVIECHRPEIVILDSVQQVFGSVDENKANEVGAVYGHLMRWRDVYGITFVLVHHTRKGETRVPTLDQVRGSTAHTTQASTVWIASDRKKGFMDLHQCKRREANLLSLRTSYQEEPGGRCTIKVHGPAPAAQPLKVDEAASWITAFLTERKVEVKRSEIHSEGDAAGHSKSSLERATKTLVKDDTIESTRTGYYRICGSTASGTGTNP